MTGFVRVPPLPASHLEAIDISGFDVIGWQNKAVLCVCSDGKERNEWLPRDLVHWEKRLFISFRNDDEYSFPGWQPQKDGNFGGRHPTVQGALAWFDWLERQS